MSKKKSVIVPILPTRRDVRFHLPAERICDWHDAAGPVFTAFLNTFSIVLPVGERFFIDSVRAYRDQITDPELKKGSSRNTGKSGFDLQKEVAVIPVTVGHAFDDLDAIVDALQQAGVQVMGGTGDNAVHIWF